MHTGWQAISIIDVSTRFTTDSAASQSGASCEGKWWNTVTGSILSGFQNPRWCFRGIKSPNEQDLATTYRDNDFVLLQDHGSQSLQVGELSTSWVTFKTLLWRCPSCRSVGDTLGVDSWMAVHTRLLNLSSIKPRSLPWTKASAELYCRRDMRISSYVDPFRMICTMAGISASLHFRRLSMIPRKVADSCSMSSSFRFNSFRWVLWSLPVSNSHSWFLLIHLWHGFDPVHFNTSTGNQHTTNWHTLAFASLHRIQAVVTCLPPLRLGVDGIVMTVKSSRQRPLWAEKQIEITDEKFPSDDPGGLAWAPRTRQDGIWTRKISNAGCRA